MTELDSVDYFEGERESNIVGLEINHTKRKAIWSTSVEIDIRILKRILAPFLCEEVKVGNIIHIYNLVVRVLEFGYPPLTPEEYIGVTYVGEKF